MLELWWLCQCYRVGLDSLLCYLWYISIIIVFGNYDPHDIHVDDVPDYQVQSLLSEVKENVNFGSSITDTIIFSCIVD